ncbi:MAG: acetoin utilization protein AcuC [Actinomycetota bacterium]
MSERVGLYVCREAGAYDHGPQHPLRPERFLLTWDLIEALGLDRLPNVDVIGCRSASDEDLRLVHSPEFLEATRNAGHGVPGDYAAFGYGPGDNPIFPNMHEAAVLGVGGTLACAEAVWSGAVEHAFNAAGGLHHAMPSRASGFCVYDDAAVGIARLLELGAARVAYVDIDVHHGDGPEAIFQGDDRVLTASIHEYGPWFFPGTGGESVGTAINAPLDAGTRDNEWLDVLRSEVLPAVRGFEPDVLVTQLGCDTHVSDPLASLSLTTAAYRAAGKELHALVHELTNGRWVATGGGGYQWARVVPRAWTLYFSEMCGEAVPDELPSAWVERAEARAGGSVPSTFSDQPG